MFYNEKYPLQKLKTHIDVIRGVSYKPVDIKEETSDSISVILRSNNIINGQINFDDVVYVDNKRVTTEQVLSKGDIVMCGSNGSKKLVGKAAMINTIPSYRTSFGAFCLGIRCKESILPEYLSVYFQTPKYREVIEFLGSGSNILNIKPEHIYNLEIPIPSLEDQKHFVTIAEQADKSGFDGLISQFIEMFGQSPLINDMNECFSVIRNGANIKQGQIEGGIPITRIETISEEIVDRAKMGYAGIIDDK
ncbi:putative type I restriction enzyme EcoKI specificity protein, partial [Segatella baroniae B14]